MQAWLSKQNLGSNKSGTTWGAGCCFLKVEEMIERGTGPQERRYLLSKQAVTTETPAALEGAAAPSRPHPGTPLTSARYSRLAYLKVTHSQSTGPAWRRALGCDQSALPSGLQPIARMLAEGTNQHGSRRERPDF